MPPRRPASSPNSDLQLHPSPLERPLLQFKLKAAGLNGDGPSKTVRELRKIAHEFESLLPAYEAGLPGLQLTLAQASRRDAQGIVDSARTLTDNCVSLFRTLISKQPLDPELVWVVLRPVLRLLLWLVPEHVPSSETLEALARQPAMQQAASTRTQQVSGPQQRNAPAVPHPEDWRSALATAYLAAVATAPLAVALCRTMTWQVSESQWARASQNVPARLVVVEQAIFWTALFFRLRSLAYEMDLQAGGPGGPVQVPSKEELKQMCFSPPSPGPFSDLLWCMLAERTDAFTIITEYVFCYMKGMLENANAAVYTKNNRPLPPVYASMECYMSAARMYKPSEALLSAVGVWASAMTLMKRSASLTMFWPTQGLLSASMSASTSLPMTFICRWFLDTAVRSSGPRQCEDELGDDFRVSAELLEEHIRAGMLMLKEELFIKECNSSMREVWANAALSVTKVVDGVVRHHVLHHAGARCHESSLTEHMLLLTPKHIAPDKSALMTLIHSQDVLIAKALRQSPLIHADATSEGLQQWSRAAEVTAYLVRLLIQLFGRSTADVSRDPEGGVLAPLMQSLDVSMELMRYLRPPSVLEFAAGGHYSQGWATCFANAGDLMSVLISDWNSTGDLLESWAAEDATAFRALLAPALPLLLHTAATFEIVHQQTAQSGIGPAPLVQDHEGVVPQIVPDLSAPGSTSPPASALSSSAAAELREKTAAEAPPPPPPVTSVDVVPADSALLLLMGASAVVEKCVAVGLVRAAARDIVSGRSSARGSQDQPSSSSARTAGNQGGSSGDDLLAAFKSLLSLARLLVSDGPWWEEARAKYPLLLIEALFKIGTELGSIVEEVVAPVRDDATEPVRQALLAVMAGQGGTPGAQAQLSITDLVIHLFMRLWGLLHDPAIVGQSDRPAAWLPKVATYMKRSIHSSTSMVTAIDEAVASVVGRELSHLPVDAVVSLSKQGCQESRRDEQLGSGATATAAAAGPEAEGAAAAPASSVNPDPLQPPLKVKASRVAHVEAAVQQLARLLPRIPWAQVHAPLPKGAANLYPTISMGWASVLGLQQVLCGAPLFRMVCLLALCGRLGPMQTEQLRQMLGGGTDPSSSSLDTSGGSSPFNPGPWQEPSSLAAPGPQRTQALQQLAQLVILEQVPGNHPQERRAAYVSQVHAIFRASGLPHLTDLHERKDEEDGYFLQNTHHHLYKQWCFFGDSGEVEAFLAWLQRGLLHIITTSLQQ